MSTINENSFLSAGYDSVLNGQKLNQHIEKDCCHKLKDNESAKTSISSSSMHDGCSPVAHNANMLSYIPEKDVFHSNTPPPNHSPELWDDSHQEDEWDHQHHMAVARRALEALEVEHKKQMQEMHKQHGESGVKKCLCVCIYSTVAVSCGL